MSMTMPSPSLIDVVARLGVGHRAPGAGRDDGREGEALGAVLAGVLLDLPGDLLLGPAGLDRAGDVLEGGVAQGDGGLQGLDLVRLLDDAQRLDEVVGGHEVGAVGLGQLVRWRPCMARYMP